MTFTKRCACNNLFEASSRHSKKCDPCKEKSREELNKRIRERISPPAIKTGSIYGYRTCPNWLKVKYQQAVNYTCQLCHKKFKRPFYKSVAINGLQAHRIKRGHKGGLYTVCALDHKENNIKIVCRLCHKRIHESEFTRK